MSIRYGMPTHRFTTSTIILAISWVVQNPIDSLIQWSCSFRIPLTIPSFANIFDTSSSETNCGIAIVMTRIVLNTFLNFIPLRLMQIATNIPRK